MILFEEFEAFLESGKDAEFSLEWILAEKQIKDGGVCTLVTLPVGISHGDLVQVCNMQINEQCIQLFHVSNNE